MIAKEQPAATFEQIERARQLYQTDDCEIDHDAVTSPTDGEGGCWVSAWVWLSDEEDGER